TIAYYRLQNLRRYHSHILTNAEDDFRSLKAASTGGTFFVWPTDRYGPATGNLVADLKRLQTIVLQARTILADLDKQIQATPEYQEQERRERETAEINSQAARAEQARIQEAFAISI